MHVCKSEQLNYCIYSNLRQAACLQSSWGEKPLIFGLHTKKGVRGQVAAATLTLALSRGQGQTQTHISLLPPTSTCLSAVSAPPLPLPPYCQVDLGSGLDWIPSWTQSTWQLSPDQLISSADTIAWLAGAALPCLVLWEGTEPSSI